MEFFAGEISQECLASVSSSLLLQEILHEPVSQLIVVQMQHIVRSLPCVLMNTRHHAILSHVLPDGLQLIDCHVLQVEEGLLTYFLALEDVFVPVPLSLLVLGGCSGVGEAGHHDPHQVHVVLSLAQLRNVAPVSPDTLSLQT